MQRHSILSPSRISTMPRAQTEARMHLEQYQRAIETSRLEKELEMLEVRQLQIKARLLQLAQSSQIKLSKTQSSQTQSSQTQSSQTQSSQTQLLPMTASAASLNQSTSNSNDELTSPSKKYPIKNFDSESYQTFQLDF